MSEADAADSSRMIFVNDDDNEDCDNDEEDDVDEDDDNDEDDDDDDEDEDGHGYVFECDYYDSDEDVDYDVYTGFRCYNNNALLPFVEELFALLDQREGAPFGGFCPYTCQRVKRILQDHPKAAGIYSDLYEAYALHLACHRQAPLELIVALTNAFPDALRTCRGLKGIYHTFDDFELCPLQHALCKATASLEVVSFLVSQWPGALQLPISHECGYFALHVACESNVSLPIIQYLIQQWPGALQSKGEHGPPLHQACHRGADITTIHCLIQAWPDALQIPNESGALPLHEACRFRGRHTEVSAWSTYHRTRSLLAAASSSRSNNNNNADAPSAPTPPPPPELLLLQTLVRAFPDAVRAPDEGGYLPLHYLCDAEPTILMDIQCLVEAWPFALQIPTAAGGMLPLHLACQYGFSLDVIQYLIDSYPLAAQVRNSQNQLPLHIACSQKLDIPVIQSLIQVWPDSVLVPWDYIEFHQRYLVCGVGMNDGYSAGSGDELGTSNRDHHYRAVTSDPWRRLALDLVCNNTTSPQQPFTMELALLLTHGTPALHFACSQPCKTWFPYREQTLKTLAALSTPEDWRHFHQGMLPLHCACRSRADKDMLLWIGENYPDALRTCTTDTMDSPLHCYLSSSAITTATTSVSNTTTSNMTRDDDGRTGHFYSRTTIQYLVEQNPAALHSANRSGWLPIHLAAMNHVPMDSLFYLLRHCPGSLLPGHVVV